MKWKKTRRRMYPQMTAKRTSDRLLQIIDALPLRENIRILEVGCGPGVAAREIARRLKQVYILGLDRSPAAIAQAQRNSENEIGRGMIHFIQAKIEEFELPPGETSFDLALGIRVGALDGRHREIANETLRRIAKALKPDGQLFIDGGDPLIKIDLQSYH